MQDTPLPAGFTMDQQTPPLPPGFTLDGQNGQPHEGDTIGQVKAMIEGGKSSKEIHDFLASVHKEQGFQGIDKAIAFRDAHPDQVGKLQYITRPGQGPINRAEAAATQFANGYTGGWMDKLTAGAEAVLPIDKWFGKGDQIKSVWDGSSLSDAYSHNLELARQESAANDKAYPLQSLAMNATGAVLSPINKVGGPLVGDLAYGASYGAGMSDAKTFTGQGVDALEGAGLNAAGGIVGRGIMGAAGKALSPVVGKAQAALQDAGVTMTPGQILGGTAKKLEDKLTSVPIVGDAIQSARARSMEQFSTGGINEALKPLGVKVPENIVGNDAMDFAQKVFDDAYTKARAGLRFSSDPQYGQALSDLQDRVFNGGADSLAPEYQKRFMDIVKGTIGRRLDANGEMSGDTLKTVLSSIDRKAAKFSSSQDVDQQEFGAALKDLSFLVDSAARRNPGSDQAAVQLMDKADEAYARMVRVESAARMRGGPEGGFTPNQLDSAVQRGDSSVRNRAYLRGDALMQDYAAAGKKVLPSDYPDSGTAGRLALMHAVGQLGGVGLGGAAGYEATQGNTTAAGLLGAGALAAGAYSKPGSAAIQNLLIGQRSAGARAVGQKLNALAPTTGRALGASLNAFIAERASR